jgi:taurine dioxygenase
MEIVPLSPVLGADVRGMTVNGLTPELAAELQESFHAHHLLCFRGEPLCASDFAELSRCFGTAQQQLIRSKRSAQAPEVSVLESTYKTPQTKPDDLGQVRLSHWHTDDSYFAKPAKATMLQALNIPSSGGQTLFCNTVKAWDELDPALKSEIRNLRAIHGYDTPRAPARAEKRTEQEAAETPDVAHPLVRTHEESGRQAIYFNPNRTDHIVGIDRKRSDEILDTLYAHMTQECYQYHHEWTAGDILLWDNRCLLHAVNTDFPVGERRRHQRILLQGTVPV